MFSLCTLREGGFVSGGGRDKKLILWDPDYKQLGEDIEVITLCTTIWCLISRILHGQGSLKRHVINRLMSNDLRFLF